MTYSKNIGSVAGGTFSLPSNSTGVNPAFLGTNSSGSTSFFAGGFTEIAKYTGTATTGNGAGDQTVTFNNIPQNYKHIILMGTISPGSNTTGSGPDYALMRMNNDSTASNYNYQYESATLTSATSHNHNYTQQGSTTSAQLFPIYYSGYTPTMTGKTSFEIWFPYYSRTESYMTKSWYGNSWGYQYGSVRLAGHKNNQNAAVDRSPITRIDFGIFSTIRMCKDTEISLYGVS